MRTAFFFVFSYTAFARRRSIRQRGLVGWQVFDTALSRGSRGGRMCLGLPTAQTHCWCLQSAEQNKGGETRRQREREGERGRGSEGEIFALAGRAKWVVHVEGRSVYNVRLGGYKGCTVCQGWTELKIKSCDGSVDRWRHNPFYSPSSLIRKLRLSRNLTSNLCS